MFKVKRWLLICSLSILGSVLSQSEFLRPLLKKIAFAEEQTVAQIMPKQFSSLSDVKTYVRTLFAGGKVEVFQIGRENFIVVRKFGSGVPDISFSLYRWQKDIWQYITTFSPMQNGTSFENHEVKIMENRIIVIGATSKKLWVLYEE